MRQGAISKDLSVLFSAPHHTHRQNRMTQEDFEQFAVMPADFGVPQEF